MFVKWLNKVEVQNMMDGVADTTSPAGGEAGEFEYTDRCGLAVYVHEEEEY